MPDADALVSMLFAGVRHHLEHIITPTLALELNVARLQGQLNGATPEERFADYLNRLADPAYSTLLAVEYPSLFQLATERLNLWTAVSREWVNRLTTDWEPIVATFFNGKSPGLLSEIRFPQRSTKRGGQAVVLLSFASGAKLVYKPRSLAVEVQFQTLLQQLNESGFEPAFRPLRLLDHETHGWMEWVEEAGCMTTAEVRRFYRRQGAYLALFYMLEATDLHMSNVIAAGEYPALIDLETLFHPRSAAPDWPPLDLALDNTIYYSVMRPGLLPEPETADEGDPDRLDLSGLGGAGGQRTHYAAPTWHARGTDAMRLAHERKTIGSSKNRPTLCGELVEPIEYIDALEEGFVDAYRLIAARRAEWSAADGPLASFANVETRVLPRSGRRYGAMLESSYHPDLLRDPTARRHYIEERLNLEAAGKPDLLRLAQYEIHDMVTGESPLFNARPHSRDILSSRGARVPGFFTRSALEAARTRVATLDETDLARQRWFIRGSFATVAPATRTTTSRATPAAEAAVDLPARALDAARVIGERLARTAIHVGNEVSWIGLEPDENDLWSMEPLGVGLAHGLPGVMLFMAHLGSLTGERRWHDLASAGALTLQRFLNEEDEHDSSAPIGLLDGTGGQLYTLAHLAALDPRPEYCDAIAMLVRRAGNLLSEPVEDEEPDLARGPSGCLVGLLAAHAIAPESGVLPVASMAADLLLERLAYEPSDLPTGPLSSFYYGPVGAAGPLLALAYLTGDGRYQAAAEDLLRAIPPAESDLGVWRAYLSARPYLQDGDLRSTLDGKLRAAWPSMARAEIGDDHSLGGGALGLMDTLFTAATALDDTHLHDTAERFAADVVEDLRRNGPRMAVPLGVESPGLMTGLAGIGYGLLRAAAPRLIDPFPSLARVREAAR